MTTKAATFASKIHNLKDYRYRIINNTTPQPTGIEIENTLKYFSQSLLSVLKDVPNIPAESYGPRQRDSVRLSVFPNLKYTELYYAVLDMIDIVPTMQIKQLEIGENVLKVLGCLVPFLEHDLLDSLPYTVASTLAIFPPTLHKDTIDLLCSNMLPMTLGFDGCLEPSYASESAAAIITMVLQHTDNGSFHSQIMECFMSIKRDLIKDILSIIAYGPPAGRAPAANLLFYYWPQLSPSQSDTGRRINYRYVAWPPVLCQRRGCVNSGNCQAVKMCLNPALAIHSGDKPPPLYICSDCAEVLRKEHSEYMTDILLPMSHASTICENKNCKSRDNLAMCTCFSIDCASFNGNRPIRYCQICHESRHNTNRGRNHVYHVSVPEIWDCSLEMQRYLMDAIVSLLKEAQPIESKRMVEMGDEHRPHFSDDDDFFAMEEVGERKLLSRYGIWLMVELCSSREDIPIEILGRLLGMLFQWFDATAYLPDDNIGNALEKLKPGYIYDWLEEIGHTHFEVIVSCLLPHPVEYARVGGFWDTLVSRTTQIKEGLNCFFCLVPYDIITFEIWDYVMPYWLEAIRTEVPTEDLHELKVLLSKAFDIQLCPLPFTPDSPEKILQFISDRFTDTSAYVQEQALQWLQILSTLDVIIPINMLLNMFQCGVENLCTIITQGESKKAGVAGGNHQQIFSPSTPIEECPPPLSPEKSHVVVEAYEIYDRETELVLPCFCMMLDMCLKQLELQEFPKYLGIYNETSRQIMSLLTSMLNVTWDGSHTCSQEQQASSCTFCQNVALWHQLTSKVMCCYCPRDTAKIPPKDVPKVEEMKFTSVNTKPSHPMSSPTERKSSSSNGEDSPEEEEEKEEEVPQFDVSTMPIHLQLFHQFLQELCKLSDTDALYSLLVSMKYLILHGECLNYTINQCPDFVKYCLSKHFIPNLWKLLKAKHSHLASVCVPLLLHCLTLPTGADIFWKLVEDDFSSDDWRCRFAAVEKVIVLARLLDRETIQHNQVIQTALAHAFCLLIGSLVDINAAIAQRTIQYLETIKTSSVKCLCQCMEFQFDHVISDRIMILQRMQLLANVLKDQKILSWEFFLARFDSLSLEAQLDLENNGDIACPTDLTSSDRESEHFLRKINRARFAMARTDSIRSLSTSMNGKPPYRRAVSVPMHLITKTTPPKLDQAKEKSCIRQQSEPYFNLGRRMTTKLNMGTFGNMMFPGGQLKEFTDEESNFTALLQKAMDMEGVDRDTVYTLVNLLMKFMVKSEHDNDDKNSSKTQNVVLRHLNILLGYNQTEKSFSVPPNKLRTSAVFNAFLSGVPAVLDRNFTLGNTILPITLLLLQYSPSPQRYASDYQPPNYTLWFLEPHTRISWLSTLLVILYKYQFYTSPVSAIIQTLIRIVINTLDAQHHHCKTSHDDGFPPPSPSVVRSKDNKMSNDLEKIQETETPPQSPKSKETVAMNLKTPSETSTVSYTKEGGATGGCFPIREQSVEETTDTPKRPVRQRKPRKIIEYNEPDMGSGKGSKVKEESQSLKEKSGGGIHHSRAVRARPLSPLARSPTTPIPQPTTPAGRSPSPAKILTTPTEEKPVSPSTVESIMAQQLQAFSTSKSDILTESATDKTNLNSKSGSAVVEPVSVIPAYLSSKGARSVSSSITDGSSSRSTTTTTADISHGGMSEIESAEDSEKTQTTSDADDSEKHTDSGGDMTQEENKGDQDLLTLPGRCNTIKPNFRQRKARKTGLTTVELQKIYPDMTEPSPEEHKPTGRRSRKNEQVTNRKTLKKPTSSRYGENVMVERCPECNAILEQYDEDTIGYCIVVLSTFIHREPSLATPLLLETLQCVSKIASSSPFVWQGESNLMVPGNSVSIARQFLRCCLHQLAPNGVFPMLFQSNLEDPPFFKTMAAALVDFNELTCHAPIQFLLEGLNNRKNLPPPENLVLLLNNLSTYMNYISLETSAPMVTSIISQFDIFMRKLPTVLPNPCDTTALLKIILAILKVSGINNARYILEPFSKLLSFTIQNCSFKLQHILDICSVCNRVFFKERDKLYLTRTVIFELIQAMKFKHSLPDENFLLLVQFVVLDAGGTIGNTNIVGEGGMLYHSHANMLISTCAAECMRDHLHDSIEFVADPHTLTKVKSNMKGGTSSLNEDTLGSQLKSGIAQYVSLEMTRCNGRDNRAISRYLPWLYHPPSTVQQGPKEFTDCIGHIRLLSWLLIGSLTHTAMTEGSAPMSCLPIPLDASTYIAEHVLVIMTGFDERSKDNVLHMSSLFHAFILCQLWTIYCESAAAQHPIHSDSYKVASSTVMDFWGRVTPGILQMLATPKEPGLAEKVNQHFLSLMEALRECNSSVLAKLFPMWTTILFTHHSSLSGQVKLQTCENWEPPSPTKDLASVNSTVLLNWLKRSQFKLGQIEVQSSAATQFYAV
ncbi:protein unc-79 homolog isoform X2 [Ylistrum balloti]|uniref:protein unc-79 homolog isoform X2 n=1 Tax=Ylistrum balloti TaxID=509963 RepID=UPI002905B047|nr:protein unc-79 homolog isoform X2 [Ylistrum balloti]